MKVVYVRLIAFVQLVNANHLSFRNLYNPSLYPSEFIGECEEKTHNKKKTKEGPGKMNVASRETSSGGSMEDVRKNAKHVTYTADTQASGATTTIANTNNNSDWLKHGLNNITISCEETHLDVRAHDQLTKTIEPHNLVNRTRCIQKDAGRRISISTSE
ncbi:hypothetical protein CBL_10356 [Carabus blaptoides fortunei]